MRNVLNEEKQCDLLSDADNFRQIAGLFKQLKIKFWIDQGTLLGAIRDNNLLPWDHDIDIAIWEDDFREILDNLSLFENNGYVTQVFESECSVQFRKQGLREIDCVRYRLENGFAIRKWQIQENISDSLINGGNLLSKLVIIRTRLQKKRQVAMGYQAFLYEIMRKCISLLITIFQRIFTRKKEIITKTPARFFASFSQLNFFEIDVFIPENYSEYLSFKYGTDWQIPKKEWQYWKQDGAIS